MPSRDLRRKIGAILCLWAASQRPVSASVPPGNADRDLTAAIERRLLADDAIPAELIDITTDRGLVTLSGIADNILEKERADDIVSNLIGVRGVNNEIVVEPVSRNDRVITSDIRNALLNDPATAGFRVDVTVSRAMATLKGRVSSGTARRLVQDVVETVKGLREVKNALIVLAPSKPVPDDELAAEVKEHLNYDLWLDPSLIEIHIAEGVVKLSGSVGSLFQKQHADRDAWIEGVRGVDDSGLSVADSIGKHPRRSPLAKPDDLAIQKAIEAYFQDDPRVRMFHLGVLVVDGQATLTGIVDNLRARRAAQGDAHNTVGVDAVIDDIRVRVLTGLPDDDAIAGKIRAALGRDPYLDQDLIRVSVRHGLVYLYGGTDSPFEKERAEEVASMIVGVVAVRNRIIASYIQPPKSDSAIRMDAEFYWLWNPQVPSRRLHIAVQDSIATITGTVTSAAEKHAAIRDAYQSGALNVLDQVKME